MKDANGFINEYLDACQHRRSMLLVVEGVVFEIFPKSNQNIFIPEDTSDIQSTWFDKDTGIRFDKWSENSNRGDCLVIRDCRFTAHLPSGDAETFDHRELSISYDRVSAMFAGNIVPENVQVS